MWADQYIKQLKDFGTVTFKPKGNSMLPYIKSGQTVTVESADFYQVGDIVLCEVNGRQFLHFIKSRDRHRYQIGNAKGHINGWTNVNKIYGKVVS